MFAKQIYQWNAVDVVRSDGELDRGLVVDKHESHLLVDFDIAGKQPELVPCQNASLSSKKSSRSSVNFDSSDDVSILRQLSKDQPWRWYSAKVLIRPRDVNAGFALVKIRIGYEGVRDCVRLDCIRRYDYIGKPMRKSDFVREECPVPDGFSYDTQSIAPWRERFPRAQPIGIVDNTFHFLQLRYDKHFSIRKMIFALSNGIPKDGMQTTGDNRGIKRPHEEISRNEAAETSYVTQDLPIDYLPLDILGIVFSFLDGRQQTRVRRVCPAWNFKILSPECLRHMTVDLNPYGEKNREYTLASWLFHCITKWTKYVTMALSGIDLEIRAPWHGRVMSILKNIMEFKSPLTALILYNIHLKPIHILSESRTAITEDMQTVCSRLVFRDVTIVDFLITNKCYVPAYNVRTNSSDRDLRIEFGSVSVGSQNELLDCFEAAVTDFTDPKHRDALKRVSEAIAQISDKHGDMHRRSQIISVLKDWQKDDIRFGSNMEWKHVQLAQLSANLLTLHNTTLSILVCLTKGWKRRVYFLESDLEDELENMEDGL